MLSSSHFSFSLNDIFQIDQKLRSFLSDTKLYLQDTVTCHFWLGFLPANILSLVKLLDSVLLEVHFVVKNNNYNNHNNHIRHLDNNFLVDIFQGTEWEFWVSHGAYSVMLGHSFKGLGDIIIFIWDERWAYLPLSHIEHKVLPKLVTNLC